MWFFKRLMLAAILLILPISSSLCIDMYLPAYSSIASTFHVNQSMINLSMGVYLIGLGLGQLIYGPCADRFGRKKVLLVGLVLFTAVSFLCSLAPCLWIFIVGRFLQAIGACSTIVLSRAIVTDIYPGKKRDQMMSLISAANIFSPTLAPLFGGYLLLLFDWRAIFWFIAGFGVLMSLLTLIFLPESLIRLDQNALNLRTMAGNLKRLLNSRIFMGNLLGIAALYAMVFVWVTNSPIILMHSFNIAAKNFGYYFLLPAMGFSIGALFAAKWTEKFCSFKLVTSGYIIMLSTLSALAVGASLHLLTHPLVVMLPIIGIFFGMGFSQPITLANAFTPFTEIAGFTSGIIGFIQTSSGGLIALMTSDVHAATLASTIGLLFTTLLLALGSYVYVRAGGSYASLSKN